MNQKVIAIIYALAAALFYAINVSCSKLLLENVSPTFMVKECIRVAKADGYKAVRLDTVPDNHPANGLYLKNDFSYVGTEDLRRDIPEIPLFNLYELNL